MSDEEDLGDVSEFTKPSLHPDEVAFIINILSDTLFGRDDLTLNLENYGKDNLQDIKAIFEEAETPENLYAALTDSHNFKKTITDWLIDIQGSVEFLTGRE